MRLLLSGMRRGGPRRGGGAGVGGGEGGGKTPRGGVWGAAPPPPLIAGACAGSSACPTGHVIVDPAYPGRLAAASAEEEDMLDLATGVRPTWRLGCQIVMTEELDGLTVHLPDAW